MRDVARFLDSHERVRVATDYAVLPPRALSSATEEALAATTPALYASACQTCQTCQTCHGAEGLGTASGPPLNAQPAFYLSQQPQDWQVPKRRNDGQDVMLKVAQQPEPGQVNQLILYLAQIPAHPAPAGR